MEEESFSLGKFLFGSIKKKLGWGFGMLVLLLVVMFFVTYNLERRIEKDSLALKDVEAPLNVMVEQVVAYDAILTGAAHWALLHTEKGEFGKLEELKAKYDSTGAELDNLLKVKARNLINQSSRGVDDKNKVYEILNELDRVNLLLVDLEVGAFDAMAVGDSEKARSLIVSVQYEGYKKELADLYGQWANVEAKISEQYRQDVLKNSRDVQIYSLGLGILVLIISGLVPFYINYYIARPILKLTDSTREIEKGNFSNRVDVKTGDELEELGNALNKTSEALSKMDDERKQVDKAKTEFLSITSHELRSPMTPMKAQLQMLMGDYFGKLNGKQKESVDIVLRNTERLDRIIQDFLEISRIEAARLKFNFIKTNLEEYVRRVIEEMKAFMPENKIDIQLRMDKLQSFESDPDRVMQVLRNLLSNAIKFSDVNGKVIVNVEKKSNLVLFSVQDFGIGIPKEVQSRIFEPFFQGEQTMYRKYGGNGLGLAICKGIVESQNGKIWFESEKGKGTKFYFTLPFMPVREIKPIRLLFSNKGRQEEDVKKLLISYLGPLGEQEFNELQIGGISESKILDYMRDLTKKKIFTGNLEEFKNKLSLIYSEEKEEKSGVVKERKVGIGDLTKSGLIKRR